MDADCIIKITKAGLKEAVLNFFDTFVVDEVKLDVVDEGLGKGYPDAKVVEENIEKNKIKIVQSPKRVKGDAAIIGVFNKKEYDLVGTDDKQLIKRLMALGIPHVVPGILLYLIYKEGKIEKQKAISFLEKLSSYISDDEYSIVKFLIEGGE